MKRPSNYGMQAKAMPKIVQCIFPTEPPSPPSPQQRRGSGGDVLVASPITDAEIAKLRTSCNPFIEWLNSAEEDDDDEEEDEED